MIKGTGHLAVPEGLDLATCLPSLPSTEITVCATILVLLFPVSLLTIVNKVLKFYFILCVGTVYAYGMCMDVRMLVEACS